MCRVCCFTCAVPLCARACVPPNLPNQSLLRSCISVSLPVFGRLADVVTRLDSDVLGGHAAMKLTWRLHVLHSTLSILSRR